MALPLRRRTSHHEVRGRAPPVRAAGLPAPCQAGAALLPVHVGDVDAARDAWEDLPDARRVAAPMPTSALYERILGRWRAGV